MTGAEAIASWIVLAVKGYLATGSVFAVFFALILAGRIDPAARDASWGFRLLILPSAALLWPLLVSRVRRQQLPPAECNAHRLRAANRDNVEPVK